MKHYDGETPYTTIQIDDHDHDHDDSSTEVDETVDLNEKDYMQPHEAAPSRKTGWLEEVRQYRWMIEIFLLVAIIFLLLEKQWSHQHGKDHYFEGAGDLTGFAPECTLTSIITPPCLC
jgi:hypothetical protein